MKDKVGVLGGGSFGITCSLLASKNKDVILYCRNEDHVTEVNTKHTLKNRDIPTNVIASSDVAHIAQNCKLIVPVVPSAHFRDVIKLISPHLNEEHVIIHATKGLECQKLKLDTPSSQINREDIRTMCQIIEEETSIKKIGCLAGPNLAKEIMSGQPATTVIASEFDEVIQIGRSAYESSVFKVFGSYNLFGTELAGAFKNAVAIASGLLGGLKMGKNLQAACIIRAWHEIIKTSIYFGAKKEAFLGIAGMGDLIATATSEASRNYTFGLKLAEGKNLHQIKTEMEEVAEGVYTIKVLHALISKHKIEAPLCNTLYRIIYEGFPAEKAIPFLMRHPFAFDVEF